MQFLLLIAAINMLAVQYLLKLYTKLYIKTDKITEMSHTCKIPSLYQ